MMKRLIALLMAMLMLFAALPAVAEDAAGEEEEEALTQEELDELLKLDEVDENEVPEAVVGNVYQEMNREDFNKNSPAIYTCYLADPSSIFTQRSLESKRITYINSVNTKLDVLYVGSYWAIVRYNNNIGYIKRDRIHKVTPVDPVNTPPYGTQKSAYIATTAQACEVRKSMSDSDASWVVLKPGTKLSIWKIQDGWAIVPYWRTYGYIDLNDLTDLIPVSPTDDPITEETPIAAYTSYYDMSTTKINQSRLVNIDVACQRLTRVMQPGESLNFNKQVGPYRPQYGYQKAWVLVNGESVPGYGGGTCQVSSTLYNALLQLPGVEILQRRPHGPAGAKYLPHGVDAAVGNDDLNLRFRNNYDFPIRVEGHTSYDGALLMVVYKVNE
ncbi:MAG: VanW family protein [Clostridia bacterium]|nr:VanW family protein [Clostridia bacterium]